MAAAAPPLSDPEPSDDRRSIVEVVGQRGRLEPSARGNLRGTCPFCGSTAFHLRPSHETFHCFGCGAGGDATMFLRQLDEHDR